MAVSRNPLRGLAKGIEILNRDVVDWVGSEDAVVDDADDDADSRPAGCGRGRVHVSRLGSD